MESTTVSIALNDYKSFSPSGCEAGYIKAFYQAAVKVCWYPFVLQDEEKAL